MKKIFMMIAALAMTAAMQAQTKFHDVEANEAKGPVKSISMNMMGNPINFDFTEDGKSKMATDENNVKYNLIGVINHYGGSSFGHYTAYCLNDNQWYEYNDESVSIIRENNVVSSAAYVLFYKRISK